MCDQSNTPAAVRAEDQSLIEAINGVRRRHEFSDAAAKQLVDDFAKPPSGLRQWIFDLCDPSPCASPFMTDDDLAAFTRGVSGQDCSARWADLTRKERRLARRIEHFAPDKKRVWMGAGPPQNVDRALVLYVIRLIEERTGVEFGFWRHRRRAKADEDESSPLNSSGGPMLRLAEAALRQLFRIADNRYLAGYLGLVSPARHYKPEEIVRTAKLARRASRTSPASPVKWPSAWILAFPGDVRSELVGNARHKNKDQGPEPSGMGLEPRSSWVIPREVLDEAVVAGGFWTPKEVLETAVAEGRPTRLKYGSGLDVLQENLKSGTQPDLIELAKRKIISAGLVSPMCLLVEIIRAVVAELPDEPPASPPPSTGKSA